jgi:hypothetical protein
MHHVDEWVISHGHPAPMYHMPPCRSITGLTASLTPVPHQPTSPINLITAHHGSTLPSKPLDSRNHSNTLTTHSKPTLAQYNATIGNHRLGRSLSPRSSLRRKLLVLLSPLYWRAAKPAMPHKWLLERPLLVPRRDRCCAALQSYSLSGGRLGLLKKPWLPCSFTMGSEKPLRQRCNVDSLRSLAMPSHPAEGSCAPYRC